MVSGSMSSDLVLSGLVPSGLTASGLAASSLAASALFQWILGLDVLVGGVGFGGGCFFVLVLEAAGLVNVGFGTAARSVVSGLASSCWVSYSLAASSLVASGSAAFGFGCASWWCWVLWWLVPWCQFW